MNEIHIELDGNATTFAPGDEIAGVVKWSLDDAPRAVEVRLAWHTEGRGDTDVGIVYRERFVDLPRNGDERFVFTMPAGPVSFSGKLITLSWLIEAFSEKPDATTNTPIALHAGGVEVNIEQKRTLHAEGMQ